MGKNAEDAFIDLLEQLLKFVTWQEALARACGELLESDWAKSCGFHADSDTHSTHIRTVIPR
ncbi:helicase [Pseudomonas putida]|nr:helicase [Pseudomonas putida]